MTKDKKGRPEVRNLIDRGRYVRYEYLVPGTKKRSQNKVKLILKGKRQEEFYIIPIAGGRFLVLPTPAKYGRKIWNGKKAVGLWK